MLSPLCPLATAIALAATAPEAPPATPPPAPPRAAEAEGQDPKDGEKEEDTWVDTGHAFVEQRIFKPVLWLDRFFSDERDVDPERSRSFLRWRSEVRLSEDDTRPVFTTGVRATLRLPGLNKQLRRLRIVIAGETRDAVDRLFPRRTGPGGTPPGLTAEEDDIGTGDAGLRFYLWDSLLSHADLGGGVLARIPPGVYGRLRMRWAVPVKKVLLTRTVVTGFWRTDTRFGTSAALELERPLSPMFVARLAGSTTLTEVSHGLEWSSELALLAFIDARSAAQLGVAVKGVTAPAIVAFDATTGAPIRPPKLDRYRVYTRLRRDMYRRWLFVELEPEVAWPWSPEEGRHAAWGMALRLEVQFQGREAPPPRPPPPPPEPEDPEPEHSLPREPGPG